MPYSRAAILISIYIFTSCCNSAEGICPGNIATGILTVDNANMKVGWPITYNSGQSVALSSIFLIWPSSKGNLIGATLDNDIIWTGSSAPPAAMLSSLTGTAAYRTISSGQTRTLWFNFQGNPGQVIGNSNLETNSISVNAGTARAYPFNAIASGRATTFNLYIPSNSLSTRVVVGLYSSNTAKTHPAAQLSTGSRTSPTKGAWNAISISPVILTEGETYWLVVLSPIGYGSSRYFDRYLAGTSERSSQSSLSSLPSAWTSGSSYSSSKISAYLTGYISGGSTSSDYSIRVNFNCGSYAGYPGLATCNIAGLDTVCSAISYWHNASVTNEDPRYAYTYAWNLDTNNVGSGKSIHVNWGSYSEGSHTLYITQTEKYGSITTCIAGSTSPYISKNVFVINKPIPVINFDT